MNLKYIKTFKTIIEEGSFLNASYKLGYTQSTVTLHIQQLEKELNLKLFEKVGRKMHLTSQADDIMPYFDVIINSMDELINYHKETSEIKGKLRIAMPETLLIYKMQNILKEFKTKAPNVELSFQGTNCYDVKKQLINGSIDLGIHYNISGYNDSIVTNKIKNFELVLVGSSLLDKEFFDFLDRNQTKPFSIISNNHKSPYKEYLVDYLKDKNIIMDNILEVGSIEAAKQSVISNLGIAYLPRFSVEEEIKSGKLIELNHEIGKRNIKAIYAYHKNKHISKAMSLFIDLLYKNLENERN